jgi:pre-rRNA-processing protein TSR1
MRSLGFPSLMCAVNGLHVTGAAAVQQNAKRLKELTRFVDYSISTDIRILDASDAVNVARQLSTMPCSKEISWRAHRSYLVADKVEVVGGRDETDGKTVMLTGFIRGNPLYVHSLAHLCGIGTVRIASVEVVPNVHAPLGSQWGELSASSSLEGSNVYHADKDLQDSLVMTANGDVLAGEQTWPSEEEMMQATSDNTDTDVGRNRRNVSDKSVGFFAILL